MCLCICKYMAVTYTYTFAIQKHPIWKNQVIIELMQNTHEVCYKVRVQLLFPLLHCCVGFQIRAL